MGSPWWHLTYQRDVILSHSLAPDTFTAYRTGINHYLRFCHQFAITPLPLSENIMEPFVVSLQHLAYKSIKVYLCGVQFWSTISGFTNQISDMDRLEYVLRGIRRTQGNRFTRPMRAPITWELLQVICRHIISSETPFDRDMLLSAALLAFFGLLRVSEYTSPTTTRSDPNSLSFGDVTVDSSQRVARVHIKKSKTDPFRVGVTLRICAIQHAFCPAKALIRYLSRRGTNPGPFFIYNNGSFLTRARIRDLLARSLPHVPNINTHSFRRGGASALSDAGVEGHVIQILGRWKSDAYIHYIQMSDEFLTETNLSMVKRPARPKRPKRPKRARRR